MTRFRGMISTQPGSTPVSSFKILALDECDGYSSGGTLRSDCGKSVFVDIFLQKLLRIDLEMIELSSLNRD